MIQRDAQFYGVSLPSRERRFATITVVGVVVWILSSREFGSAASAQFLAILLLAAWAGMASLWFP
jgi:hypothetical protein